MIEPEVVSSPTRPPRYHLFFTVLDADNNRERLFTHAFRTAYAAHYWVNAIFSANRNRSINWRSSSEVVFTDLETQRKLIIKENCLEDLVEYTPTKEESKWTPPYPDNVALDHLVNFHISAKSSSPTITSEPVERPKPQLPHRKTKAPSDPNQITVAQLAQKAGIPANKARQILRKAGFKKPPQGWTYQKDDPIVETIQNLFKG